MKIAFRLSSMKFGGAERVFLSVAERLSNTYQAEIHFVVDKIGTGETETVVIQKGFQLYGLASDRTMTSIFPLKKYLETHQPDVLISGYTDTNMAALLSAKLAKHQCKVIVSEHASLQEHWQHASLKRKLLLNAYVRFGYRLADHLLAVSKGIAEQIIRMGHPPEKVSFIYNPVRFQANQIENKTQKTTAIPTILAVGRITKQKDYLTLLHAFDSLSQQLPARLMIVGAVTEAQEKEKLDRYIAAHDLAEKVIFSGFTEDVQRYYQDADVFVLSSAWEGFGNAIVEALAFGLPVVSTDCKHGPAEILENNVYGRLVAVGDWRAMANALLEAIHTKNMVDKEMLIKRSLDFSEEKIASEYWALIQRVVAKSA